MSRRRAQGQRRKRIEFDPSDAPGDASNSQQKIPKQVSDFFSMNHDNISDEEAKKRIQGEELPVDIPVQSDVTVDTFKNENWQPQTQLLSPTDPPSPVRKRKSRRKHTSGPSESDLKAQRENELKNMIQTTSKSPSLTPSQPQSFTPPQPPSHLASNTQYTSTPILQDTSEDPYVMQPQVKRVRFAPRVRTPRKPHTPHTTLHKTKSAWQKLHQEMRKSPGAYKSMQVLIGLVVFVFLIILMRIFAGWSVAKESTGLMHRFATLPITALLAPAVFFMVILMSVCAWVMLFGQSHEEKEHPPVTVDDQDIENGYYNSMDVDNEQPLMDYEYENESAPVFQHQHVVPSVEQHPEFQTTVDPWTATANAPSPMSEPNHLNHSFDTMTPESMQIPQGKDDEYRDLGDNVTGTFSI